jgi:hypothetical protein
MVGVGRLAVRPNQGMVRFREKVGTFEGQVSHVVPSVSGLAEIVQRAQVKDGSGNTHKGALPWIPLQKQFPCVQSPNRSLPLALLSAWCCHFGHVVKASNAKHFLITCERLSYQGAPL